MKNLCCFMLCVCNVTGPAPMKAIGLSAKLLENLGLCKRHGKVQQEYRQKIGFIKDDNSILLCHYYTPFI